MIERVVKEGLFDARFHSRQQDIFQKLCMALVIVGVRSRMR